MVSRKLNVEHIATAIDFFYSHLAAVLIGLGNVRLDVVYEASLESARKYGFFVFNKDVHAFVFQQIYGA